MGVAPLSAQSLCGAPDDHGAECARQRDICESTVISPCMRAAEVRAAHPQAAHEGLWERGRTHRRKANEVRRHNETRSYTKQKHKHIHASRIVHVPNCCCICGLATV